MNRKLTFPLAGAIAAGALLVLSAVPGRCVSLSKSAWIEITDDTGSLSWNPSANALTVSCWFKLTIPSGEDLADDMTILVNRKTGAPSDTHAFHIFFNRVQGRVEFTAKGSFGLFTLPLVERPHMDRWYHVAVVRSGDTFLSYIDGRPNTFSGAGAAGNTSNTDGVSIGGLNGTKLLHGEVQEVAIYQSSLTVSDVRTRMFRDQRTNDNLRAYFKLGASTNESDHLKNFVPTPPAGTDAATARPNKTLMAFEETDQAGEQSAFDSRKNRGEDAIAPLSGAFFWSQTAFARPTPGIALDFQIAYSSAIPHSAPAGDSFDKRVLGPGWRHTFDARLVRGESSTVLNLITWEGAVEVWDRSPTNNNVYLTRHKEYRGELARLTDGDYEWTTPQRLVYRFRNPDSGDENMDGRLLEIRDFNSNRVQISWNEGEGRIVEAVDTAGGRCAFGYSPNGPRLTNMTFQNWSVSFDYDAQNRLISKSLTNTAPASSGIVTNVETKWQFFYNTSSGLLERIMDPRGNTNIFVAYDQYERKTNQVDALGRVTKTEYNAPAKRQVRHTDPEGTRQGGDPAKHQWLETYDRKGRVLVQRDPLGNETRHTYDERGNRTSLRDPLGNTTFYAYDSRANVTAETNALGEVRLWEYHSFFNKPVRQITPHPLDVNGRPFWTNYFGISDQTGNLTNHWDDLGPLVRYTYRTNGLVETATDANGNVTRFDYDDTNGFLRARIDPAGHTNLFLNNDVGWKLAEINALRQVTRFSYDLNGNVVRTLDPLHRTFTRTYDANGNLLSASDAKGQLTTYAYDAANQRTNMVDRTRTNTWSYTYTPRGEVATIRDPLLNTSTNFHDAANRLIRVESPLNLTHRFEYDPNGNRTNRIDQLGRSWKTRYDRLNRVIAESDPLGNTRQTTYDVAGRIQTITTPNGHPSLHFYDGRGRLKLWQDAEGFPWRYLYDGVGNIVNIIDALNGNYSMAYSNRNERILEKNQDGFEWTYRYDPLLRLEFQRDPNGTTRALKYDAGGRIESVTFNTGRVNAFLYDDNNNPEVLSRSGSGPPTLSQLRYDAMDRVTEYTDAFGKRVQYGYDALGRATSVTYPGGKVLAQSFDALGRLTNQVFNSQFTNTYAYDKASRLIRRAYPNGVTQTNVFDDAGRITDLSYLTNSPTATNALMALTYAYDRNGNKTAATEKGTLDWPMPTLMDETSGFTLAGRLTNRVDALNPTNSFTYKYDASGNMTNSAGGGQDWCLTYDEDNRVMSVDWDCGMTEKRIANRYDAFGRRVSRTVDGTETRFVLDLSGTMERILCDADGSGAITAWYVHGPDLAFKVDSTNGLTCYHADAMANIIALTGTGGTNTAQYAYTPYGRSLGSTNLQSQIANPYQFVGSHGVMEELPGLYFMRARYYSADAGVFLSTDPLKKIGPGWKPVAYHYADGNPVSKADPQGEVASYVAAFGSGFAFGAKKALIDETIQRSLEEFAIAAGIPQEHVGFVSGGYDFVMMTLVDIPVSAALITADFYGAAGHGTATVAGYWAGKELSKKGVNEGFDFLKGNGSRYITWGQQSFLNDSGSTGAKQRISPSNSSSSSSLLAEKHPDAAAYAESQNVNYSTSSKAIREIYDRGQTARNNLIDSLSQGKRANESQSAYMDRLVNKLKSDLSTTPKNKAPQPKKKK